jgi:hypothetical protein|tara:strand:- start:144 stop:464 length:321 start_codon:yes stop_codon:yes gene_type:complete
MRYIRKLSNTLFICFQCGPFNRVLREVWNLTDDGPYKVEFIQHIEGMAYVVDEVFINTSSEESSVCYDYCGICNRLINIERDGEWLLEAYHEKDTETSEYQRKRDA